MYCVAGLGAETCGLFAFSHAHEYDRPIDFEMLVLTAPAAAGVTFCPDWFHVKLAVPDPVWTTNVPLKLVSFVSPVTLTIPMPFPPGTVSAAARVTLTTPFEREIAVMFCVAPALMTTCGEASGASIPKPSMV